MKRIIYLIVAVGLSVCFNTYADEVGDVAKVWTDPVIYLYDQEVTWYFDLSGTGFSDSDELYMWAWSPSEPDVGNWENGSDFAKLEYIGGMTWKKYSSTPNIITVPPRRSTTPTASRCC